MPLNEAEIDCGQWIIAGVLFSFAPPYQTIQNIIYA